MSQEERRWAMPIPDADTAPILQFVEINHEAMLGECTEFDATEVTQMRPGIEALLTLARDDHEEAEGDFAAHREVLTTDPHQLTNNSQRIKNVIEARRLIETTRERARTALEARLEELATTARALGFTDDDFTAMARWALNPIPEDTPT